MPQRNEAEEHLRVIRSLMEKATIYRAISTPTALVAGLAAVGLSVAICMAYPRDAVPFSVFVGLWSIVLAVVSLANGFFIWREAKVRGEIFISPGMRLALRAMLPSLLCGAVLTFYTTSDYQIIHITTLWMIFYGLSLLSTAQFAPRSIVWLGRAFVVAGLLFVHRPLIVVNHGFENGFTHGANLHMALTFGLFHLIYAACTWRRRGAPGDAGGEA